MTQEKINKHKNFVHNIDKLAKQWGLKVNWTAKDNEVLKEAK